MARLTWNKQNNVTYCLVLTSVVLISTLHALPQHIKDGSPIRDLSDMEEDLATDTDAEFESRKIETTIPTEGQEPIQESQHFFPSFTSIFNNHPLGHSRPPIFDDPPNNHRARHIPYALQQANSFQGPSGTAYNSYQASQPKSSTASASTSDNSVLGSGNFGVIRGGTFYEDDYDSNDDYFYPYNSNNGHGRPTNNYYNHQPAHSSNNNGDFFANFRDFADITAPKSAYSEFHIIYVNKNGTEVHFDNNNNNANNKPRNIFEQLTKLDESESKLKLKKKGINSKEKLALFKEKENEKLYKKKQNLKSVKEIYHEPLLALS